MEERSFSILDLLDLPEDERNVLLYIARHGAIEAADLAQALDQSPEQAQRIIQDLLAKGRLQITADKHIDVALGVVKSRSTLPPEIWAPLVSSDRLYSEQEISALRIAVPMLQFARARLTQFNDHGPNHVLRVKSFANQLSYVLGLSPAERQLLCAGALFHDIGNVMDRERHHEISQETVEKLVTLGKLPYLPKEAEIIGLLCLWHRRAYEPQRVDTLRDDTIRTGLMASILRVADAMDLDYRRSDYGRKFREVLNFFYPVGGREHWEPAERILGIRIRCRAGITLQVFTLGDDENNKLIGMLRKDLDGTPLDWQITVTDVGQETAPTWSQQRGRALLVFPFNAHSLVMAALSRKHLASAGYTVECLCYPDTMGGPGWLWSETLNRIAPQDFAQLVVIGDRPDTTLQTQREATLAQFRAAGAQVTLLNRYESNWARLPEALELGVETILGSDWAYFWGDYPSQQDMIWGRIAALCTRDPTLGVVGIKPQHQKLAYGLLIAIFDASQKAALDTRGWQELAEPIMERIANDDQAYFLAQSEQGGQDYFRTSAPVRLEGRVLVFEGSPARVPAANFWALERAIEDRGRALARDIQFNVPYAIATWPLNDQEVELLAISHWREEDAIPIRLLYPTDLGPRPYGNEGAIQVRLPAETAAAVVQALVEAGNREMDKP